MMWPFQIPLEKLWTKFNEKPDMVQFCGDELDMKDADYIIVVNDSNAFEATDENLSKTIFMKMEPEWYSSFWACIEPKKLLAKWDHKGLENYNMVEWHLPQSSAELENMVFEKTKNNIVSSILSTKDHYAFQRIRLDFALYAQNFVEWDAYGTSGNLPWKSFKGVLPYHNKLAALAPYKYSFACENNTIPGYVTEKLYDCILSETLCFYSGAPNVSQLIDSRAYIQIELDDFDSTLFTIKTAIQTQQWENRIEYIRKAKRHILDTMTLFARLNKLLPAIMLK